MAMEGICQIKSYKMTRDIRPSFSFRNVNISSALVLPDKDQDVELFTTMYPEKISTASVSKIWYTFSISSFLKDTSISHCAGSISVTLAGARRAGTVAIDATGYDTWTMGRWYAKLASEGLRFGSNFQSLISIRTDKYKSRPDALSTCSLYCRRP